MCEAAILTSFTDGLARALRKGHRRDKFIVFFHGFRRRILQVDEDPLDLPFGLHFDVGLHQPKFGKTRVAAGDLDEDRALR